MPTRSNLDRDRAIVHDFYDYCERIFERVAVCLGPGLALVGTE